MTALAFGQILHRATLLALALLLTACGSKETGAPTLAVTDTTLIDGRTGAARSHVTILVEDELGSLEPGSIADLLVLTANPLEDVRNARRIEWVVKGGVPFSARSLLESTDE